MMHELELGGKVRPVLFGNLAFRRYEQATGANVVQQLSTGTLGFSGITELMYHALKAGEYAAKHLPGDYTADDVALWMDEGGVSLEKIMLMITDSMTPQGDEAAKKKAKARPG
jgi:hypothetical protein